MLQYQHNDNELTISEAPDGDDIEFKIEILDKEKHLQPFHQIRDHFNNNHIYTDVMFYSLSDHEYQVIVKRENYIDFVLSLFKYKLLTSVQWVK